MNAETLASHQLKALTRDLYLGRNIVDDTLHTNQPVFMLTLISLHISFIFPELNWKSNWHSQFSLEVISIPIKNPLRILIESHENWPPRLNDYQHWLELCCEIF